MRRVFKAKTALTFLMALVLFLSQLVGPSALAAPTCEALFAPSPEIRRVVTIQNSYQTLRESDRWWKSHMLYLQHLKVFREFAREIETLDEATHPELKNEKVIETFKRLILRPYEPLSPSEVELIASQKTYREVFSGLMRSMALVEYQYRALKRMGQYWQGPASVLTIHREAKWSKKALALIRALYNGPVRFLVPVVPLPRVQTPVSRIFEAQFKNPDRELTSEETALLQKYGAEKAYQEKQEFMKSRPTWTRIRRWIRTVSFAALTLNSAMAANWALHLADPKAFVSSERFFNEAEYRLAPNQVRLYNESVPFPHMAIEIDGRVYSYGQTHMTVRSAREYLLSQDIAGLIRANEGEPAHKTLTTRFLEFTGLNQLNRSVQMVTLNLSVKEKGRLKRDLELATGSEYRNHTFVLDCATMVVNAIKRNSEVSIPEAIDASPSSVLMYLGALKSFEVKNKSGEPLIADVKQVAMGAKDQPVMHLLRNTYINALEGKLWLAYLPSSMVNRAYFDIIVGEEGFQYWNPEIRSEVLSWQKTTVEDLKGSEAGRQLEIFVEHAQELGVVPRADRDADWKARVSELQQVSSYYFDQEIKTTLGVVQSPNTAFGDLVRNAYRYDLLNGLKLQIEAALEGKNVSVPQTDPAKILDAVKSGDAPYGLRQ